MAGTWGTAAERDALFGAADGVPRVPTSSSVSPSSSSSSSSSSSRTAGAAARRSAAPPSSSASSGGVARGRAAAAAALEAETEEVVARDREILRECVRTCAEAEATGVATLAELEQQGAQLDRMNGRLVDMEATMDVADRHIRAISSWFGALSNRFRARPDLPPAHRPTGGDHSTSSSAAARMDARRAAHAQEQQHRWGEEQERAAEAGPDADLEADLDELSAAVAGLKSLALATGSELDSHHDKIGTLAASVDRVDGRINRATNNIRRV